MALGPNDVEARMVLRDDTSGKMAEVEKNLRNSTDRIKTDADKTASVFDKWNFNLNLVTKVLGKLKGVLATDTDFAALFEESSMALGNAIEYLLFLMTPGVATIQEFKAKIQGLTAELAKHNLEMELVNISAAVERIGSGENIANLRKLQAIFRDLGKDDLGINASEGLEEFNNQIKEAEDRLKILSRLTASKESGGLGLTRKQAEALLDLTTKVATANTKVNDFADKERDAAKAAADFNAQLEKQREEFEKTFGGGFRTAVDDLEETYLQAGNISKRFVRETHSVFSNDLFAALKREGIQFADFIEHLLDGVLKQVTDAISAQALSFLGKGLFSSFFGGTTPGVASPGSSGGSTLVNAAAAATGAGGGVGVADSGIPESVTVGGSGAARSGTAQAVTVGGGGDVHIHHHWSVEAIDGESFERLLSRPEFADRIAVIMTRSIQTRTDVRGALNDG